MPLRFRPPGPVTIVPLQRPNAVLLIGRKENIPSMIELISKLDQPGADRRRVQDLPPAEHVGDRRRADDAARSSSRGRRP